MVIITATSDEINFSAKEIVGIMGFLKSTLNELFWKLEN